MVSFTWNGSFLIPFCDIVSFPWCTCNFRCTDGSPVTTICWVEVTSPLEEVTYNSSFHLWLSQHFRSHVIKIQAHVFTMVTASHGHVIPICNLPTSKINEGEPLSLSKHIICLMTVVIRLTTVAKCHKIGQGSVNDCIT